MVVLLCLARVALAGDRFARNAECEGCHTDIAAEWRTSLHQKAWVDPVFRKAYDVEPLGFCRGCHAPESDPAREPTVRAQHLGIGCVTCHERGQRAHQPSPALRTTSACAGCHQFDFPAHAFQVTPEPMQDTVREHAASTMRDTPCQDCHMPLVDGPDGRHRSHRFTVIADAGMLKRAVEVTAERRGAEVRLSLVAGQVGHAFPTGDMFRRLEVRAQAIDAAGRVAAAADPVVLARTFVDVPRDPAGRELTFMRVQSEDTRVPPPGQGARRVTLVLPDAARGLRVRWLVAYQRMSTPMAEAFGVSQVLDEVIVAEGELP